MMKNVNLRDYLSAHIGIFDDVLLMRKLIKNWHDLLLFRSGRAKHVRIALRSGEEFEIGSVQEKMRGSPQRSKKSEILSRCDAMIVASLEAFCVTALEGLASRLVVLARDNPGIRDMKDNGAEITFSKDEPGEYAEKLVGFLQAKKEGKFKKFRMQNRKVVERFYSRESTLEDFENGLHKISEKY